MPNTSASGGYLTPTTADPASDLAFHRQLNDLVAGVSGLPGNMVRPRWQPEPPPIPVATADWAAIGETSSTTSAGPYFQQVTANDSDPGHAESERHELVTILVSFYGPNSSRNAKRLRDGMFIAQNWETAHDQGLGLYDVGPIRNLPEQINATWYLRTDLELRINRQVSRNYDIQNIVSASGHIQGDREGVEVTTQDWSTENV